MYPVDRLSPARHVAAELGRAFPEALPIGELAGSYTHPNTGDLARVREHERTSDPVRFLIEQALEDLGDQVDRGLGLARLAVPPAELRLNGQQLVPAFSEHEKLGDPFNPRSGIFSGDIRRHLGRETHALSMPELKESLRLFGWLEELPAIRDENGVVITGHRRLEAVAELAAEGVIVEPKWQTIRYGRGDEADARRFRTAIASNLGAKGLTAGDRRHIATYLYKGAWDTEQVARKLGVPPDAHSDRKPLLQSGRKHRKIDNEEIAEEIRRIMLSGEKVNHSKIGKRFGVTRNVAARISLRVEGRLEAEAALEAVPPPPPPRTSHQMAARQRVRTAIQEIEAEGRVPTANSVARHLGYTRAGDGSIAQTWDELAADHEAPLRPRVSGWPRPPHEHECVVCGGKWE